jgi:transposase
MPRLRQNDRERSVGLVQAGMTHHAIADHFNVSRITISRLMIRRRQTGRTNYRPRNDSLRETSKHQDSHLRLIHIRNRMITAEDIARRTPGLANVLISGQTVPRRLRESGLRARRPVVGPILKQRHRITRLAWARARRRWQHILFSDKSRFSLRFSDARYRVYRRRGGLLTNQCVYESDRFGGGSVMIWAGIFHDGRTQLKIVQGILNVVKYRRR